MNNNQIVEIANLQVYEETDNAILVGPPGLLDSFNSKRLKVWLPSDLVSFRTSYSLNDIITIEVPQWLADKKDLDYDD